MPDARPRHDRRTFLRRCASGAAAAAAGSMLASAQSASYSSSRPSIADLATAPGHVDDEAYWALVRRQFSLEPGLTYLNNGGLGPSPHAVVETITRELLDLERTSETGHDRVAAVRKTASSFLHCDESELAITRNATEGMNCITRGLSLSAGDEVLLTTHEHPGGAMPWVAQAKHGGIKLNLFDPGTGGADTLNRLAAAITPRTRIVVVSHVTCTTGLRLPVQEIAAFCRARDILSAIDGAQAIGMLPVDLHAIGCDFYVASGHKWLLGPKGTGLLCIRRQRLGQWRPPYVGAYSDQTYDLDEGTLEYVSEARCVEYGTRNTPLRLGLQAAIEFINTIGIARVAARGQALANYLQSRLEAPGVFDVLTPRPPEASGAMVTFRLKDRPMDPWKWANALRSDHNIRVRPVGEHKLNAVRVSTHVYNTYEQLDCLIAALQTLLNGEG